MSDPHNHHYIPQFYQRGFMVPGSTKLWVYEKERQPQRYSTRKTGMKIDFYAFQKPTGETDFSSVENTLKLLDDRAAKIIRKLEEHRAITERERLRLCEFVSVMWRRTVKHQKTLDKMARQALPVLFDSLKTVANRLSEPDRLKIQEMRRSYIENPPAFLFARNVVRNSAFEKAMFLMDWAIFTPPKGKEFLTCDDPARINGAGLKNRDALIFFPLSRKILLQCKWNSGWENGFHELTPAQVDYFNLWTVKGADVQVYSAVRSDEIKKLVDENIASMEV